MYLILLFRRFRRQTGLTAATQELHVSLSITVAWLLAISILHMLAMHFFEGMAFGDAAWLTVTTLTTVGYGDYSATTIAGRLATVFLLYIGGIFILGKVIGDYFDYRSRTIELKRKGEWNWTMRDHIVIINAPGRHADRYFVRLIERLREPKRFRECPIQILTSVFPNGLPASVTSQGAVVQTCGHPEDVTKLEGVNPTAAAAILVLAEDEYNPVSDSRTFDTVHRLKDLGTSCRILAECVDDNNRVRLLRAGATNVTRPMRAYPGMLVRSLMAPGSEQVVEDLFRSGTFDFHRFDITLRDVSWKDVVLRLLESDIGTAMAYVSAKTGKVVTQPEADEPVEAAALLVLVSADRVVSDEEARQALNI